VQAVLPGDGFDGVHLLDNANLNRVSGNLIGLNVNNAAAGNAGNGVYVLNCQSNLIGALVAIGRNIISANAGNGIQIGTNTIQANLNYIFGNFIGTDTNGLLPRGNAKNGILLQGCTNIIIGSNSAPLQLISGNVSNGIKITRSGLNQIYDNYIGLGVNGLQMIPNGRDGIHIEFGSSNVIGGAGQFNVISANGNNGVFIRDSASRGNLLQENFIGTDETGLQDRGNNGNGVLIYSARENVLNQNVISGNNGAGVRIEYGDANNRLTRNRIGTDPTGLLSVSNNAQGVYIGNGASFNVVGGSNAGEGNIIAFNNDAGVTVASGTNNAVLGNSIFQNRRLGITLVDKFGPSTNDYQDPDSGANFKQNYPVIYSCATGSIRLGGTINSMTSTTYRVEFFLNELPDASGYGEGRYFLGFTNVTTDANGDANFFQVAFTNEATTNQFITATATDPNGNSSEFSAAVRIVAPESFDADGDGMPNIWEIGGGIDPYDNAGANGASGNPDNDPYSNLEEYIADTSPSDGASYLRWTDAERITNSIVTYSSTNSRFYLIQYASQLGHLTPEWQNLYTPAVQGSNSVTSYADTNVTPGRVYRVGVRMIP
jgi:hypothetical protein